MTTKKIIDSFIAQKTIAVAGVSRSGMGFGCLVLKHLAAKGYEVLPVHPSASEVEGFRCYPSLTQLPKPADALVLVVPPEQTEILVREAFAQGIRRIWMQPGAESPEAVRFCERNGIELVYGGDCVLVLV
ncbi:MAG: CoA-binding protein [Proteobacteria bacterium]|nr:CoA-binding protein [Pseudomonadota bacterium]